MSRQKILFLGYVWPETRSSGAGVRTRALVEQVLASGAEVHFAAPSSETVFAEELRNLGIQTHSVQANDSRFDLWIRDLRPDAVILDRFVLEEQFGWRIRENSPHSALILDLQDLHFLRKSRESQILSSDALAERLVPLHRPDFDPDMMAREIASIFRADLSLVISSEEVRLLLEMGVPSSKVLELPFSYRAPSEGISNLTFSRRQHFVSLGNFRHPPNLDSVRSLAREIWPRIRARLPEAELHLYGAYPPREVSDLKVPGLRPMGPCPDAIRTLSGYRVLLAPLRFGAGLKGKIADSWFAGTAVCTTSIGAEGLSEPGDFPGQVSDVTAEFIRAAVDLYQNQELWERATQAGQVSAHQLFHWNRNEARFVSAIAEVGETLSLRRKSDYLRTAFLQQEFSASKYLSKWIEAKNALRAALGTGEAREQE